MTCRLCGGSRHVFSEERGGYVACECLQRKQRTDSYRRAGVPGRYDNETWRTFVEAYTVERVRSLLAVAKSLKAGDTDPQWILAHGRPTRARMLVASLVLRSACDGGLEGRLLDLPKLIDAEFQPGRGEDLYRMPVLVIEVGSEPGNKWNTVVMEKLVHKRWEASLFTMLVVEGEPTRVLNSYKSSRVTLAASERFLRVRVGPKEED